MNILFVLKTLEIGGVEVVSSVLANKFSFEDHNVSVFAFEKGVGKIVETFDSSIKIIIGKGYCKSFDNISILHQVIKDNHIDIIINQWGLPLVPIKSINRARIGSNSKVISVFHLFLRLSMLNCKVLSHSRPRSFPDCTCLWHPGS